MSSDPSHSLTKFGLTLSVSQISEATARQEHTTPLAEQADPRALLMASLLSARPGYALPTPVSFARLAIYGQAMTQAMREGTGAAWTSALLMLGEAALEHTNPVAMVAFSLQALAEHVDPCDIPAQAVLSLFDLIEGHRILASKPSRWRLPLVLGEPERTHELFEAWQNFSDRADEARTTGRPRGPGPKNR